ncbi:hypothetical protein MRX96_011356 [Rhipicephalus microplus]
MAVTVPGLSLPPAASFRGNREVEAIATGSAKVDCSSVEEAARSSPCPASPAYPESRSPRRPTRRTQGHSALSFITACSRGNQRGRTACGTYVTASPWVGKHVRLHCWRRLSSATLSNRSDSFGRA